MRRKEETGGFSLDPTPMNIWTSILQICSTKHLQENMIVAVQLHLSMSYSHLQGKGSACIVELPIFKFLFIIYSSVPPKNQCWVGFHNCLFIINSKYLLHFLQERHFYNTLLLAEAATQRYYFSCSMYLSTTPSPTNHYLLVLNLKGMHLCLPHSWFQEQKEINNTAFHLLDPLSISKQQIY